LRARTGQQQNNTHTYKSQQQVDFIFLGVCCVFKWMSRRRRHRRVTPVINHAASLHIKATIIMGHSSLSFSMGKKSPLRRRRSDLSLNSQRALPRTFFPLHWRGRRIVCLATIKIHRQQTRCHTTIKMRDAVALSCVRKGCTHIYCSCCVDGE
jgi:hypothetical protein